MGLFDGISNLGGGKLFGGSGGGDGGGGRRRPKEGKTTRKARVLANAFSSQFPTLASGITDQIQPVDEALLASALANIPQFAALQRQTSLDDAAATRSIFTGDLPAFQEGARTVEELAREFSPEFFDTRVSLATILQNLLAPELTGGERTEVERSLARDAARSGNAFTGGNIETVSNALNFGNAARQKFTQAAQTAAAALPSLQSPVSSPSGISATPRTQTPIINPGTGIGIGENFLSQLGGIQGLMTEAHLTPQPSDFERVSGSLPDY